MVAPVGAFNEICPPGRGRGVGPVALGGLIRSLPDPWARVVARHSSAARTLPRPPPSRTSPAGKGCAVMAIVADRYGLVIGVDTHAASHTFALLLAGTGAVQHTMRFPASAVGLNRAV